MDVTHATIASVTLDNTSTFLNDSSINNTGFSSSNTFSRSRLGTYNSRGSLKSNASSGGNNNGLNNSSSSNFASRDRSASSRGGGLPRPSDQKFSKDARMRSTSRASDKSLDNNASASGQRSVPFGFGSGSSRFLQPATNTNNSNTANLNTSSTRLNTSTISNGNNTNMRIPSKSPSRSDASMGSNSMKDLHSKNNDSNFDKTTAKSKELLNRLSAQKSARASNPASQDQDCAMGVAAPSNSQSSQPNSQGSHHSSASSRSHSLKKQFEAFENKLSSSKRMQERAHNESLNKSFNNSFERKNLASQINSSRLNRNRVNSAEERIISKGSASSNVSMGTTSKNSATKPQEKDTDIIMQNTAAESARHRVQSAGAQPIVGTKSKKIFEKMKAFQANIDKNNNSALNKSASKDSLGSTGSKGFRSQIFTVDNKKNAFNSFSQMSTQPMSRENSIPPTIPPMSRKASTIADFNSDGDAMMVDAEESVEHATNQKTNMSFKPLERTFSAQSAQSVVPKTTMADMVKNIEKSNSQKPSPVQQRIVPETTTNSNSLLNNTSNSIDSSNPKMGSPKLSSPKENSVEVTNSAFFRTDTGTVALQDHQETSFAANTSNATIDLKNEDESFLSVNQSMEQQQNSSAQNSDRENKLQPSNHTVYEAKKNVISNPPADSITTPSTAIPSTASWGLTTQQQQEIAAHTLQNAGQAPKKENEPIRAGRFKVFAEEKASADIQAVTNDIQRQTVNEKTNNNSESKASNSSSRQIRAFGRAPLPPPQKEDNNLAQQNLQKNNTQNANASHNPAQVANMILSNNPARGSPDSHGSMRSVDNTSPMMDIGSNVSSGSKSNSSLIQQLSIPRNILDLQEVKRRRIAMRHLKKKEDNYSMSEKESTDEDEDDDYSPDNSYKRVPAWCSNWIHKISDQSKFDPDSIFGTKIKNPELATIFGSANVHNPKRRKRGSSQNWDRDKLTMQEIRAYKNTMGQTETALDGIEKREES